MNQENNLKKPGTTQLIITCLVASLILNGCSVVYRSTGNAMIGFAQDEGVSFMMQTDDVDLSCAMVESFAPFLMSFSRVTESPDKLAIVFYLMAGNCAEFESWEQELRYLRAIHAKDSLDAEDARIAQQRLLNLAARRQLKGYSFLSKAIAEPGESCPAFSGEDEQFYWLLGLINGLQAIINDIASGGHVQVPMSMAAKIGRAAACLDSQKWWGIPDAIQGAIWMTIPGSESETGKPEQILDLALETGLQKGVAISQVLAAQIYLGKGDAEKVKQIIRSFARINLDTVENRKYRILNEVARYQIQTISDRLWTAATGVRTPIGSMGTFWDDQKKAVDTIDIDELL